MGFVGCHMGSHVDFGYFVSLYHWMCSCFMLVGGLCVCGCFLGFVDSYMGSHVGLEFW